MKIEINKIEIAMICVVELIKYFFIKRKFFTTNNENKNVANHT